MLPDDHFLSLAVREAMKPWKDWELAPPSPELMPDFFGADTDSSPYDQPGTAGSGDGGAESSESVPVFQWRQIKLSSSEEDGKPECRQESPAKSATFGVLLAQLHFILSILSKDDSYLRLPASRDIHRCALIGGGHSFSVRRASKKEIPGLGELSDPYFVVKTANIINERDATARMRDILREVQILTHEPLRSHPNVVKLLGFGWEQLRISDLSRITRWPYLLLEYAKYGSIVDLFEQHVVGLETRVNLCLDVGSGIKALHVADIVHGDVKLENILIFSGADGRLIAKIADFGFAEVDLDGSEPDVLFGRGTLPWKAPEAGRKLSWSDLFLMDVYSYGFLIWRTIAYGHRPFVEAGGLVSKEISDKLEKQKLVDDGVLSIARGSISMVLAPKDRLKIELALTTSLQRQPALRDLGSTISALGGVSRSESLGSLRTRLIPPEQGLGIYNYGGFDNRLDWQMMQALHSFCGAQRPVGGPLADFVGHCASTLSGWYIDRWTAGVEVDDTNSTTRSLAWRYVCMSACSGSDAASEALYSIFYMMWPSDEAIPTGAFPLLAGGALKNGMEFILREVMDNDVPGKEHFLKFFATRLCRGSGLLVGSPDPDIPLMDEETLFKHVKNGQLTPEAIFRMAATWGQLSTVCVIYSRFKLDLHVFSANQALNLARLLRKHGANPNAVAVNSGNCNVEAEYWFFKGPPLIRAVASGNKAAVCGLLAIGANPLVPIRSGDEDSLIFAARRLRAPILELLLKKVPKYPVWEVGFSGNSLLATVIGCSMQYAAKIHGRGHEKARIETFDLL
ncbi:MAG: hypothetical protein M1840_008637 [Geoglossum simile]|nr:MAG: hypothetical protein M1840_008637 [Geoglossum simile]